MRIESKSAKYLVHVCLFSGFPLSLRTNGGLLAVSSFKSFIFILCILKAVQYFKEMFGDQIPLDKNL